MVWDLKLNSIKWEFERGSSLAKVVWTGRNCSSEPAGIVRLNRQELSLLQHELSTRPRNWFRMNRRIEGLCKTSQPRDRLSSCLCRLKLVVRTIDIDDLASKRINPRLVACPERSWGALPWDRILDYFSKSNGLTSIYVNPVNFPQPSNFLECLTAPEEPSPEDRKLRSILGIVTLTWFYVTFVTSIDFSNFREYPFIRTPYQGG